MADGRWTDAADAADAAAAPDTEAPAPEDETA
jgi:hypothetical protein